MTQAKFQRLADDSLLDHVRMSFELIADGRANEVGAVRIKTLVHHQIDVTQVDVPEVHRNFLGITGFLTQIVDNRCHLYHPYSILLDGIWMAGLSCQGAF